MHTPGRTISSAIKVISEKIHQTKSQIDQQLSIREQLHCEIEALEEEV